jgi:hypothetical protein
VSARADGARPPPRRARRGPGGERQARATDGFRCDGADGTFSLHENAGDRSGNVVAVLPWGRPRGLPASAGICLDAAYTELAAAEGPDPTKWRADATKERITFGLLPETMRWTNRPTFQQVITFAAHRPRR